MPNNKNLISPYTNHKGMADDEVALQILELIEQSKEVSQRKITNHTGLATGLVHSYMRRIINKGWVKATQVSARRWLYYLTPEGFLEKSRLTVKYLSWTLQSYQSAQNIIKSTLDACRENKCLRLVVAGDDHLAEILILNIKASDDISLAGVIVEDPLNSKLSEVKLTSFNDIQYMEYDRVLVSDVKFIQYCRKNSNSEGFYEKLIHLGADGVINNKVKI